MSKIFEVHRHANAKDRYFVNAQSDAEAIEKVTLRLADLEGVEAWTAVQAKPPFEFHPGDVVDGSGKPIKSVDL